MKTCLILVTMFRSVSANFSTLFSGIKEVPKLDRKSEVYLNLNAVTESCFRFSIIESVFGIHIYFFDFLPIMDRHCVGKKKVMWLFLLQPMDCQRRLEKGFTDGLKPDRYESPFFVRSKMKKLNEGERSHRLSWTHRALSYYSINAVSEDSHWRGPVLLKDCKLTHYIRTCIQNTDTYFIILRTS